MIDLTEKTLGVKRVFEGRALIIDVADIELPNGRRSIREIVRHRGAAVIIGERPDGKFVLVYQYRRSIEETILELVAGCLEEGEPIEDCARREMEEESGYQVTLIEKFAEIVPCPGYSEERLHLFYAKISQEPGEQNPDFDENLVTVVMSADEIYEAIDSGRMIDAKSIAAWLLWCRKRDA
ncbi:MAG: NUDIX hydrolase [Kiritimatiellae bacterium]|jgi:ADP-ribose pyrophosphatase|nr:NUDIX hydrolase [Kiritimatiellia bacterium]